MQLLKTKYFETTYENGSIRWLKSGGNEVVRMIYSAVRDRNWGTLDSKILDEKIIENKNGFKVGVVVEYLRDTIHFRAEYKIEGQGKKLSFEMVGEALSTFKTCRVGFCVLHPVKECSGKKCEVIHRVNNKISEIQKIISPELPRSHYETSETKYFPNQIAAHQPMKNISEMKWNPSEYIQAKLIFYGDTFEMEDQRNWTDASYKTYCRPLALPFPFEIKKGEIIGQKIELEIETEIINKTDVTDSVLFTINRTKQFKIPEIGVCVTSREEPLSNSEAAILNELPFQHLRAELKLFKKNWKVSFFRVVAEGKRLNLPLFLVLYFSDKHEEEIEVFEMASKKIKIQVNHILVLAENHLPNDTLFDAVSPPLQKLFPDAQIGSGVNAYFAELNRNRPKSEKAGFVNFTICPQVHAFDNASLIENLEAQKYAVESAKKLFPGKPVSVSPVTLKQRFNIVATSDEHEPVLGELPSQVDVRQHTLFAAQWILGSLKYLTQSGAGIVTFFETVGWRGFVQGDFDPPVPSKFSARKADIFPIYYLLKEFKGFKEVVFSESNRPLDVDGIVLSDQSRVKGIIANFSAKTQSIHIGGINFKTAHTFSDAQSVEIKKGRIEIPASGISILE